MTEDSFFREQLITCIGNKRSLLPFIATAISHVLEEEQRQELTMVDLFTGSGAVARLLKQHASRLVVNDLEPYAETLARCYLSNSDERTRLHVERWWRELSAQLQEDESRGNLRSGLIAKHYAPADDTAIRQGERVFYTRRNACFLDTARTYIGQLPSAVQPFLLAPLMVEASVHANTAGVFKGFYKDRETGIGRFGGSNGDALTRITGSIQLLKPLFSRRDCPTQIMREDANAVATGIEHTLLPFCGAPPDVVYLDPPYNQHPYGSNYFMLNLLQTYRVPEEMSQVSGIPRDWNRSRYNKAADAPVVFAELVEALVAGGTKYILFSWNSEGFLAVEEIEEILRPLGELSISEQRYNAFRGSRNLRARSSHVREYLFLLRCHRRRYI